MSRREVFIIAEAGVNHNGSLETACKLIDVAAASGANAVKFQTFRAEKLVTADAPQAKYQIANTGKNEGQYEMLKKLELSPEAHFELKALADKLGIEFMSTPFDEDSADLLEKVGVKRFKLSSGDLVNYPLLVRVAKKGLPIIISSGMATIEEVEFGINSIRSAGNNQISLLHCVSNYPADEADCNLLAIKTLADKFGIPIGWSDHTNGEVTAIMAVALGASIIEKHFTLDKNMEGPDHKASLAPDELANYVSAIRRAEKAMGDGNKRIMPSEENTAAVAKRSIAAKQDIKKGEIFALENLTALRPSSGISPLRFREIIGKKAAGDIAEGSMITEDMVANG